MRALYEFLTDYYLLLVAVALLLGIGVSEIENRIKRRTKR